jgi:hypothetical protein
MYAVCLLVQVLVTEFLARVAGWNLALVADMFFVVILYVNMAVTSMCFSIGWNIFYGRNIIYILCCIII